MHASVGVRYCPLILLTAKCLSSFFTFFTFHVTNLHVRCIWFRYLLLRLENTLTHYILNISTRYIFILNIRNIPSIVSTRRSLQTKRQKVGKRKRERREKNLLIYKWNVFDVFNFFVFRLSRSLLSSLSTHLYYLLKKDETAKKKINWHGWAIFILWWPIGRHIRNSSFVFALLLLVFVLFLFFFWCIRVVVFVSSFLRFMRKWQQIVRIIMRS